MALAGATAVGAWAWRQSSRSTPADAPVTLHFAARVGPAAFGCGTNYPSDNGESWTPTDLRLFISDVRLLTAAGHEKHLRMDEDPMWQTQGVALLDFEDAGGACINATSETRTIVTGRSPLDTYTGVAFTVGLPFDLNHADPAQARGPLTQTSMHWGWRAGHKFLRFGAETEDGRHCEIHLGSTHCEGTIGQITGCGRTNRVEVKLDGFRPGRVIVLDVGRLLSGLSFKTPPLQEAAGVSSTRSALRCMSEVDEPACAAVFRNLGVDLASGKAIETGDVFSLQ